MKVLFKAITLLCLVFTLWGCDTEITDVAGILHDISESQHAAPKIQTVEDLHAIFNRITNTNDWPNGSRQEADGTWTYWSYGTGWSIHPSQRPQLPNAYPRYGGTPKPYGYNPYTYRGHQFITPHLYDEIAVANAWHYWQIYAEQYFKENATGPVRTSEREHFHFASEAAWDAFVALAMQNGGIGTWKAQQNPAAANIDPNSEMKQRFFAMYPEYENPLLFFSDVRKYNTTLGATHLGKGHPTTFIVVTDLHIPMAHVFRQRGGVGDNFLESIAKDPRDRIYGYTYADEVMEPVYRWEMYPELVVKTIQIDARNKTFHAAFDNYINYFASAHLYNTGAAAWDWVAAYLKTYLSENCNRSNPGWSAIPHLHFTNEAAAQDFIAIASENGGILNKTTLHDHPQILFGYSESSGAYLVDTGDTELRTFFILKGLSINNFYAFENDPTLCPQ